MYAAALVSGTAPLALPVAPLVLALPAEAYDELDLDLVLLWGPFWALVVKSGRGSPKGSGVDFRKN